MLILKHDAALVRFLDFQPFCVIQVYSSTKHVPFNTPFMYCLFALTRAKNFRFERQRSERLKQKVWF